MGDYESYLDPYVVSPSPLPVPSKVGPPSPSYSSPYYGSGPGSSYSVSPPEHVVHNPAAEHNAVRGGSVSGGHQHAGSVISSSATSGGATYSSVSCSCSSTRDDYHHSCCEAGGMVSASAAGVDLNDYMQDRFADRFDPIPLDRSVARQAQTSGQLNAKQVELLELQKKAQARLARTRARFADGMADAREVRADLDWTQKKVSSLKTKASRKHPKEYTKARERYPSPEY